MKARFSVGLIVMAALVFVALPLNASDPVGVYGIVERVVLAPNNTEPETAQIWGAFSVSAGQPGDHYGAPEKGYLYYTCPAGKLAVCASEWMDLKSMAGKGEVAGFGAKYNAVHRVRKADEKPASPDPYRANVGVVPMGKFGTYPEMADALKAALNKK